MKNPGPSGTSKGNMKMFYCYIKLVLGSIQYKSLYNDCAAKTTTTKTTHTYLIQMVDMTGPSHVAMPPDNAKGRIARHLRVVLWVFSGQEKSFNMNAVSICFNDKPIWWNVTYSTASCCSFFNIYSIPWWYLKDSLDCHLGLDQTSTELPG